MRITPSIQAATGCGKGRDSDMRKQAVTFMSGLPFERAVWRAYRACRDRVPDAIVSPAVGRARTYDRLTIEIARRALGAGGNAVDVGAHYGSILEALVKISPAGSHWAFEPVPTLAHQLRRGFPGVTVSELALSDYAGSTEFRFLPGSPAYSSLLTRPEVESGQHVRALRVDVRRLDDCIPEDVPIAFIKIDVEGAEAGVLRGGARLIARDQPVVVFECGPEQLASCLPPLEDAGLRLSFLADYLAGRRRSADDVMRLGRENDEYYYVAGKD
jgi:FkbM family methyltransferase